MRTFRRGRRARALLVPALLTAALLSAGAAQLASSAHVIGAVANCPLSTNWDTVTGSCR